MLLIAATGVLLFSSGPDDATSDAIFTPLACKAGVGATCLPKRAAGSIALADGTHVRARRVAHAPVCTSPSADEVSVATAPALIARGAANYLAVWPAGADVGLRMADASRTRVATAPEAKLLAPDRIEQVFTDDLDGDGAPETVFVVRDREDKLPVDHADLVILDGATRRTTRLHTDMPAAIGAELLASSDVDGDGHRELIVLYPAFNGYGVAVWEYGAADPIYRFDCGNA